MNRIHVPTSGAADWQRLLAKPERHWKAGYSAMALAQSWEAAGGFPAEVTLALSAANAPALAGLELLLAIPEYEVPLPGSSRASQTDLMVFARNDRGLVVIAAEGKVEEPFGPTLAEKHAERSDGVTTRIAALEQMLGFSAPAAGELRYQLLHRTASAILTAQAFHAGAAVMLVHSFSADDTWLSDFTRFAHAIGASIGAPGEVRHATRVSHVPLYVGWCKGEARFLKSLGQPA